MDELKYQSKLAGSAFLMCHLGQKSQMKCGPHVNSPLQTLDELDAASMRIPGKSIKISWMVLSRVGVQFLNTSYGWWTVCPNHRKEYLDAWQVGKHCCHPRHKYEGGQQPPLANHLVTTIMAIKMLQTEDLVIPISGKFCHECKDSYDLRYGTGKSTEKVVVFVPRTNVPLPGEVIAIPSPFCNPEQIPPREEQRMALSPPVCPSLNNTTGVIPSGFFLQHTNNKKANNNKRNRGSAARVKIQEPEPDPEPEEVPPADLPVWQMLGLQRAPLSNTPVSTAPDQHSTDQSSSEMLLLTERRESEDESLINITIKLEVDEQVKQANTSHQANTNQANTSLGNSNQGITSQANSNQGITILSNTSLVNTSQENSNQGIIIHANTSLGNTNQGIISQATPPPQVDQVNHQESDDDDDDDRPATPMSLFSNDSDDDPTWAPEEEPKKVPAQNRATRKSFEASLKSFEKLIKKKEKRTPKKKEKVKKERKKKEKPAKIKKIKKKKEKDNGFVPRETVNLVNSENISLAVQNIELVNVEKPPKQENGDEFHFLCPICQISFYRETAYKHHMSSNVDFHKKIEEKNRNQKEEKEIFSCSKCSIVFKDRVSHRKHMAEEHSTGQHPFFCQMCNVYLKCEAAFKSHNSKLHLERRSRLFYCRECDDTFVCKVKHADHIAIHRTWPEGETGMQCKVCGKIFPKNHSLIFHKHLATHDEEPDEICLCRSCVAQAAEDISDDSNQDVVAKDESSNSDRKRKREPKSSKDQSPRKKAKKIELNKPASKMNLLSKMRSMFNSKISEDEEVEELEEEFLTPFECGICSKKFSGVSLLESHVLVDHQDSENKKPDNGSKKNSPENIAKQNAAKSRNGLAIKIEDQESNKNGRKKTETFSSKTERANDVLSRSKLGDVSNEMLDEVTDEFVSEIEKEDKQLKQKHSGNTTLSRLLVDKSRIVIVKPTEKNWQECADRNWAAEFGYGSNKNDTSEANRRSIDLISKMKLKFFSDENEEEAIDEDEQGLSGDGDQVFRSRGLKGMKFVRPSPGKEPRTLSTSSMRSRKRMEALLTRARNFMVRRDRETKSKTQIITIVPIEELQTNTKDTVMMDTENDLGDETVVSIDTDENLESQVDCDHVGDCSKVQTKPCLKPLVIEDSAVIISSQPVDILSNENENILPQVEDIPLSNIPLSNIPTEQNIELESQEAPISFIVLSNEPVTISYEAQSEPNPTSNSNSRASSRTTGKVSPVQIQVGDVAVPDQPVSEDQLESNVVIPQLPNIDVTQEASTDLDKPATPNNEPDLIPSLSADIEIGPSINIEDPQRINKDGLVSEDELSEEDEELDDESDEEFSDFECILDVDEDSDGLLIPLENGWVCEKNWAPRSGSYTTHFWSPDGRRHASLTVIKFYAEKKRLNLDMSIFERALKNNPPRKDGKGKNKQVKRKPLAAVTRTTRSRSGPNA